DVSARLVAKQGEAGGGDQLDQAEIAAFYAELSVKVGQARLTARRERETLTRLMGLWGSDTAFTLPDDLAALPREPEMMENVEADPAMRVDLCKVLADSRARISANAAAVDARRDFELAAIDLQAALTFGSRTTPVAPAMGD